MSATRRSELGARAVDAVVDRGLLADPVLRVAIRALLRRRLAQLGPDDVASRAERMRALVAELTDGPVAVATHDANEQHYEVPTELFELMLGPNLKYSSGYWPEGVGTLEQAEAAMLELTCERAGLADHQDVLDLGCGWGSLSLHVARRHPTSRVVAVSNSHTQRTHIEKVAAVEGLTNLTVLTADVNDLGVAAHTDVVRAESFDRVVSVEMFEHVRNHAELTARIARWLRPGGALFVHVFAHRSEAYPFDTGSSGDWMARHFFTGGIMPSADLLPRVARGLDVTDQWAVSGTHYARTLRAWLDRLDAEAPRARQLLAETYGDDRADAWLRRWRVFTIACEELFAFRGGQEWHVSHHLLTRSGSHTSVTA
jgi:cyclopropane-fatty-acyl-phospholipid synthase